MRLSRTCDGRLTIRSSTQVPFLTRDALCALFDLPRDHVRVVCGRVGGGFGGKQEMLVEDLVTLAVLRTGRPVKYETTRTEMGRAVHAEAPTWADTDFAEIVGLYDVLRELWPSPVVELNRAVALGLGGEPALALAELDRLAASGRLGGPTTPHRRGCPASGSVT